MSMNANSFGLNELFDLLNNSNTFKALSCSGEARDKLTSYLKLLDTFNFICGS